MLDSWCGLTAMSRKVSSKRYDCGVSIRAAQPSPALATMSCQLVVKLLRPVMKVRRLAETLSR